MLPQSECFLNITQEFLICTTIHKARNLPVFNADTFVKVSLDKKSKFTKIYQNSENPYYNEYFVFELSCTLNELLRLTVLYEVRKKSCKNQVNLGELLIDLHTVWNQPQKCFVKKWGKLENSIGSKGEAKGHLQIDLAIVSSNQQPSAPINDTVNCDDIENNLLQNLETSPCNIKYFISLYKGVFVKKSDYIIQVSLAGMNGKTSVSKGSQYPEWNQEIQFSWTYPSLAQTFLIQIMAHEHMRWKSIAESEIYFDEISFNDIPSLGPTFIHFYDNNIYIGRILIEIKSEKINPSAKESINRTIQINSTQPLVTKSWWADEMFFVECCIWQGEFIHANSSNMKIFLQLGEFTSNTVECYLKNYNGMATSLKHFTHIPPFKAVHIKCYLPDNRLKFESDNFMITLHEQMNTEMENFKLLQLKYPQNESMHRKCLKAIILSILGKIHEIKLGSRLHYNGFKQQTVWDENRLAYLREFFDLRQYLRTVHDDGGNSEISSCDKVFEKLQQLKEKIKSIMQTRVQDEWPELHLLMCLGSGKAKEIGICKLEPRYFAHSQNIDCKGPGCGVPMNFVFKDPTCIHTCRECGCVRGIVYGWIRIATEAEQLEFSMSDDWEQKERFYYQPRIPTSSYICRVYVHQAKIRPGADKTGLCDAKLIILSGDELIETPIIYTSLSPVWNTSVTFAVRNMPGPIRWYEQNPPLLAVQVFDTDKNKLSDYLGCGLVELSIKSFTNRKESLNPIMEGGDENSSNQSNAKTEGIYSKGPVLAFKNFIKTKAALRELKEIKYQSPPSLKWVPIATSGATRVEVLISGELLQIKEDESPDRTKAMLSQGLPIEIQPIMSKYVLEVTFIGLRNSQKLSCSSLGRYKIYVLMGELLLKSGISGTRLKNSINFLESYAAGVMNLPEQIEYWPAIIATHIDSPSRGREITLGAALIPNPRKYLKKQVAICDLDENDESTIVQMGEDDEESSPLLPKKSILKKSLMSRSKSWFFGILPKTKFETTNQVHPRFRIDESEFNWWTKFYNSMYMLQQNIDSTISKHRLVIYDTELEKQSEFSYLSDWAESFQLVHGVKLKKNKPPKEEAYATLKMHLKITPCHCNTNNLNASSVTLNSIASKMSAKFQSLSTLNEQTKVIVRIYLVQGLQFRSHDAHSQSDSYVKLQLGANTVSDRAHFIPNQSNPIFGKTYQMEALIPREHILQVSIFDRGSFYDDLIGSTFIDLEDRLRSKHRATVGISNEFNRSGYNMWRDALTPYELLRDICKKYNLGVPFFAKNTVELDGVIFEDTTEISIDEDLQERLSLSVLKNIQDLPSFGYRLVPEHVETRALYRNDRPGIEQGKIQLWIEIFEASNYLPPPINITPIPAKIYELRIIIYNCSDVQFNEKNVFGTQMSDIYIKAWCEDSEASQSTDVHYRSLTGEGSFNWRMIFPIKYSSIEDMMIIKRKSGLMLEQYEIKQPPMVYLQIWENDSFSADDFMGAMEICLSNFPQPFDSKKTCTESQMKKKTKSMNLFRDKMIKGWFPCRGPSEKGGNPRMAGKLELELEILTESEAAANPVGLGRNPPNALPAPDRPETSFNPLTNPLKAIKHILGPVVKKCLCYTLIVVGVFIVLMVVLEDLPHILMNLIPDM